MPSIINAATSGGLISTADTSGVLQLQTASTTAMTINASQNVGIGTASPSARLDVSGGSIRVNEDGAGTKVITIRSNYAGVDPAINVTTNNSLLFLTNNTERMRILSTGNILSLAGGSTTATGTGIAFPATQSASSDANTLDDYEEGTWTPVLVPATGTITSQTTSGRYTKVGNVVTVTFTAVVNSGTISVISLINGLPFTSAVSSCGSAREYVATGNMWQLEVPSSTAYIAIRRYDNSGSFSSGWGIFGTVTYFV